MELRRTRYPWWYLVLVGIVLILAGVLGWVIASKPAYAFVMGGLGLLLIAIGAYRAR